MNRGTVSDVILITGGSGFLGQHIVRELQFRDAQNIKEIRILDLLPFQSRLQTGLASTVPVTSFMADICDKEAARAAFKGATCVMHLAAYIDYSFPADLAELHRVNVQGTETVIELCKEENVPVLVHCSSAEVALRPRLGPFPITVGLTEHRAEPPHKVEQLSPYAASKLKAEKLALGENMTYLRNGTGRLRVVALRPTFLFGELEPIFLQSVVKAAAWTNGTLIDLQGPYGPGCRLQFTYAGNAAWAFVRAKEALKQEPSMNPNLSSCGLPVFVTDHTMVHHPFHLTSLLVSPKVARESALWLPLWVTYPLAFAVEKFANCFRLRLPVQPTNLVALLGGVAFFDSLRAALTLRYAPLYNEQEAVERTKNFFEAVFETS